MRAPTTPAAPVLWIVGAQATRASGTALGTGHNIIIRAVGREPTIGMDAPAPTRVVSPVLSGYARALSASRALDAVNADRRRTRSALKQRAPEDSEMDADEEEEKDVETLRRKRPSPARDNGATDGRAAQP